MSQEIELKLVFPPHARRKVLRHPLIAGAQKQGQTVILDNTYFDTPDLYLQKHKIALRTRKKGKTVVQTVKTAGASTAGLSSRREWEQPFSGTFDFEAVDEHAAARVLERGRSKLIPVFSTRFSRATRLYQPQENVRILIMIDSGSVEAAGRSQPISELELELVEGSSRDLLDLACKLAEQLPLSPSDLSKAERGYRLFQNHPLTAVLPAPVPIDKRDRPVVVFARLAETAVAHWQANVLALRETPAETSSEYIADCVCQIRLALRRLRVLLTLFAPLLPEGFVRNWRARFHELYETYGPCRDLDVMYNVFLISPGDVGDPQYDLAGLVDHAAAQRTTAFATALKYTATGHQGAAMLAFSAGLSDIRAARPQETSSITDYAITQLNRLRKRALRQNDKTGDLSHESLHRLRIALKTLRYGVDFFAPLFGERAMRRYSRKLVRRQNTLGFLHDLANARRTFAVWVAENPSYGEAAAFISGWHAPRRQHATARIVRKTQSLMKRRTPWQT